MAKGFVFHYTPFMFNKLNAIFFDLDGTLVDSKLDFDLMREDLGFPVGAPILEHIELLSSEAEKTRAHEIVHEHELCGARNSTLFKGVKETIDFIIKNHIPTGVLTRNSSECAKMMLEMHELNFDYIFARDDFPAKPNPAGLLHLCKLHQVAPNEAMYVGDFLYDIQTAKNAGMLAGLFVSEKSIKLKEQAHYCFEHFDEFLKTLRSSRPQL